MSWRVKAQQAQHSDMIMVNRLYSEVAKLMMRCFSKLKNMTQGFSTHYETLLTAYFKKWLNNTFLNYWNIVKMSYNLKKLFPILMHFKIYIICIIY